MKTQYAVDGFSLLEYEATIFYCSSAAFYKICSSNSPNYSKLSKQL